MIKRPNLIYEKSLSPNHNAVVCHMKGKLIACKDGYDFLEDVCHEISEGTKNVVLEVSELSRVASSGIGILAAMYTSTQCNDGKLILVGVDDRLQHHMEIVQIWSMLTTADTIENALDLFMESAKAEA